MCPRRLPLTPLSAPHSHVCTRMLPRRAPLSVPLSKICSCMLPLGMGGGVPVTAITALVAADDGVTGSPALMVLDTL
eukprot:7958586-Pyramimonas_sp.AAC.1